MARVAVRVEGAGSSGPWQERDLTAGAVAMTAACPQALADQAVDPVRHGMDPIDDGEPRVEGPVENSRDDALALVVKGCVTLEVR